MRALAKALSPPRSAASDQGAVNDVALGMAAAQGMGAIADRHEKSGAIGIVTAPESRHGAHHRQADLALHIAVGAV